MLTRFVFVFLVCALFIFCTVAAYAQTAAFQIPIHFTIFPLTVKEGFPLQIMLTEKLHFKLGEPVRGKIVEPVYAFDREVIPSGTEALGKITGFRKGGTWKRVSSLLGADFTPVRQPLISFDTLVLDDGSRIPIKTTVEAGTDTAIRFNGGLKQGEGLKGSPEQNPKTRALTAASKQQGNDLLKGMLWNLSPYHPQFVPTGVRYKATLLEPIDFGTAVLGARAFAKLGSNPPAGSIVYARLETPLDSRTATLGAVVRAELTRPLFSREQLLIFPVGSRLLGEVVQARRAGLLHHDGELAFKFTKIEPPVSILLGMSPALQVEGNLSGALVNHDMSQLRINEAGETRIVESKIRFFAPALAGIGLARAFNFGTESLGSAAAGAYGDNLITRLLGADFEFGLPAGIAGRMIPPVGIGLGIYAVGHAIFSNLLSRGQEVRFPVNTPLQVRLDAMP